MSVRKAKVSNRYTGFSIKAKPFFEIFSHTRVYARASRLENSFLFFYFFSFIFFFLYANFFFLFFFSFLSYNSVISQL